MATASRARAGEVHFDPESPAGKEYALPLQQARNEALGTGGGEAAPGEGGGAGAAAPLFGVGVSGKGGGPGPGSRGSAQSGGGPKAEGGGGSKDSGGEGALPGTTSSNSRAGATASASYSDAQGLLLGAGILILGALIGLGLRTLSRQRPSTP